MSKSNGGLAPVSEHIPASLNDGAPAGVLSAETLISKAIEHQVPIETMERLLVMRRELRAEQAREVFYRALSAFQAAIPGIPKTQTATVRSDRGSYTYQYANIADIQRAIAPAMQAHGLSVTFDTRHQDNGYLVRCTVHHESGHSETTGFLVPIDQRARMNDAQKAGSALTYGRRYALCAALGIVTAEDDDDAQSLSNPSQAGKSASPSHPMSNADDPTRSAPPVRQNGALISKAQVEALEGRIAELDLDAERVRDWLSRATNGQVQEFAALTPAMLEQLEAKLELWAEREAIQQAEADA